MGEREICPLSPLWRALRASVFRAGVVVAVCVLGGLLLSGGAAADVPVVPGPLGLVPGYDDPPPAFSWQGQWQSQAVWVPSERTGARLYGTVFAPVAGAYSTPRPAVVILPGSAIGVQSQVQWSARDLAGHGYVALTIDPQGEGKSEEVAVPPCRGEVPPPTDCGDLDQPSGASFANWLDALESGISFLSSSGNPFVAQVDPTEIGAAGHSLGARVVSYAQGVDPRIKAIVAWDNLAESSAGDDGSPDCANTPAALVNPRVPAMGQASETCTDPVSAKGPDAKKTAYSFWRAAGIPTMELVFKGSNHLSWGQAVDNGTRTGTEAQLRLFEYYTRAWFDTFLTADSATGAAVGGSELTATIINGTSRSQFFSTIFRSAAYLPSLGVDCSDLRQC